MYRVWNTQLARGIPKFKNEHLLVLGAALPEGLGPGAVPLVGFFFPSAKTVSRLDFKFWKIVHTS
jgi:hypothetical protein